MGLKKWVAASLFSAILVICSVRILSAQSSPQPVDEATAVLKFLNQTVSWYRTVLTQPQLATQATDLVFADNSRGIALQVLRLSFEFAHADAALLQAEAKRNSGEAPQESNSQSKNLTQLAAAAQARVKQAEADLENLQKAEETASPRQRAVLQDQIAEQRSELDLAEARYQTLSSFVDFASTTGSTSPSGLQGKIQELERSVPEARVVPGKTDVSAPVTPAANNSQPVVSLGTARTQNYGIVALATDLFALGRKLRSLKDEIENTTALRDQVNAIRTPLIDRLKLTTKRGEDISMAAQSNDRAVLEDRRKNLDDVTAQFKQLSSVVVPVGKIMILLDSERSNLSQWHNDTERQYTLELRNLALRLAILGAAIGVIFLFSEFWRRAIFRYVRDVRRRSQFLLLRRILVTFCVVFVILFGFATEIGSLATFAGLITAGVALALQNVILSVAAYFFLIGKYGIRVGDRVQIGDVTGDVVDIGLVRLHLLELDTSTGDPQPTGRVVVFSNSVVFQPNSNFFKQLPGSNFGWHRITLNLAPDVDYHVAKKRIQDAVTEVYGEYRQEIERQHRNLEQNLTVSIAVPEPHTTIRFKDTSLEIAVRYPVLLNDVSAIDDRITRAILTAVDVDPKLRLVGKGSPMVQTVHDTQRK